MFRRTIVLGMEVWQSADGIFLGYPEEVQDDGLHDHTYGIEPEAI